MRAATREVAARRRRRRAADHRRDEPATPRNCPRSRDFHASRTVRERSPATIAAMTIPRSRDLRLLAGAAGVSSLGDFLAIVPLVLHVQQRTGSTFAISAIFLALWGPVVLGAGVAGAIVDRFENRALLVGVSFAQAAVVVAIAFSVDALWAVLPLVAVLGFGVAISQPAEFALVPAAAGEDGVARANGLMETVRSLGFTAGPLLGGAARRRRAAAARARRQRPVVRGRRDRGPRAAGAAPPGRHAHSRRADPRPRRLRLPRARPRPRHRARRRDRRPDGLHDVGDRRAVLRDGRAGRRELRLRPADHGVDRRHDGRSGRPRAPRTALPAGRHRAARDRRAGPGDRGRRPVRGPVDGDDRVRLRRRRARRQERPAAHADPRARPRRRCAAARSPPTTAPATAPSSGRSPSAASSSEPSAPAPPCSPRDSARP